MNTENITLDQYAQEIPSEIRRAIKGLAGKEQFGVIVLLIERGGLSHTEIKNELNLHQETLSRTLDKMQKGGLIIRREIDSEQGYQTEYRVTGFGKRVLDSLFDAIQPRASERRSPPLYDAVVEHGLASSVYQVDTTMKKQVTEVPLEDMEYDDNWARDPESNPV